MRRTIKIAAISFGAILLIATVIFWKFDSPSVSFRSLVATPIPSSVRDIHVSGSTALAGSYLVITFKISSADFQKILATRNFVQKLPDKLLDANDDIVTDLFPLDSPIYYQASELNGGVTYTIKTNPTRTLVYFRYVRI